MTAAKRVVPVRRDRQPGWWLLGAVGFGLCGLGNLFFADVRAGLGLLVCAVLFGYIGALLLEREEYRACVRHLLGARAGAKR